MELRQSTCLMVSAIIAQKTGDTILWFYYDGTGKRIAMQDGSTGAYYYYVYNNQYDVIALVDSNFNYVANYTYDSWGKLVSITGSNTEIGNLNPFRYRGYYYDSETGLYYLNSRYYNPEIGRFINADGYISTGQNTLGQNMFAYALNNPMRYFDLMGYDVYALYGRVSYGVGIESQYIEVVYYWDDAGNTACFTTEGVALSLEFNPSDYVCSASAAGGMYWIWGYDTIEEYLNAEFNLSVSGSAFHVEGTAIITEKGCVGAGVGVTTSSASISATGSNNPSKQTVQKKSPCPKGQHDFSERFYNDWTPSNVVRRVCYKCGFVVYYTYVPSPNGDQITNYY